MKQLFSFDDVLIEPNFSFVRSRKDVDTSVDLLGQTLQLGVISANMDTVTGPEMAITMLDHGAQACLHRFYSSIDENIKAFQRSRALQPTDKLFKPMVSIGLGGAEYERAYSLIEAGAEIVVIDVAHGAQIAVVEQYNRLRERFGSNIGIIVGNFATGRSILDFNYHSPYPLEAAKVGIGSGAACTTRIKTGVGIPQLSAVIDCVKTEVPVISDGGCKNAGDVVKALAAGAKAVMLGSMLAGTDESPGQVVELYNGVANPSAILGSQRSEKFKKYRGSASAESYSVQGKEAKHRAAEGEAFLIPYKGSVKTILQDINGGLRSAMSYVGADNLKDFAEYATFVQCSTLAVGENHAHGKDRK
jgi:IMP dehydrogenase